MATSKHHILHNQFLHNKMLRFWFCLCFALASASDSETSSELEAVDGKKNFDFLVFSQIWPITSCDIWEAKDPSNTCYLPKESKNWYYFLFQILTSFSRLEILSINIKFITDYLYYNFLYIFFRIRKKMLSLLFFGYFSLKSFTKMLFNFP